MGITIGFQFCLESYNVGCSFYKHQFLGFWMVLLLLHKQLHCILQTSKISITNKILKDISQNPPVNYLCLETDPNSNFIITITLNG